MKANLFFFFSFIANISELLNQQAFSLNMKYDEKNENGNCEMDVYIFLLLSLQFVATILNYSIVNTYAT